MLAMIKEIRARVIKAARVTRAVRVTRETRAVKARATREIKDVRVKTKIRTQGTREVMVTKAVPDRAIRMMKVQNAPTVQVNLPRTILVVENQVLAVAKTCKLG